MSFIVPTVPTEKIYSPRGAQLAVRSWKPTSNKIRAVCILVHDLCLHSGYFDGLARRLNRDDLAVLSYDHVGQGYSESDPGAPSGYIHVRDYNDWLEDMFVTVKYGKVLFGEYQPLFFIGEGFGAMVCLAACWDRVLQKFYDVDFAGIIVLNPQVEPPEQSLTEWLYSKVLSSCYPSWKIPVGIPRMIVNQISADWKSAILSDSRVLKSPAYTISGYNAEGALRADVSTSLPKLKNLPILLISSDEARTKRFAEETQADARYVPGAKGSLLLDERRVTETVKDSVSGWITGFLRQ